MSETIANGFPGLAERLANADARRAPVKIGFDSDARSEATRGNESATSQSDTTFDRTELGSQLEAIHSQSYGWALSCCGWDPEAAEDVLHATYLKVLDGKARFAGRASFRTWLFAVIRMTAVESRRRIWRRSLLWKRFAPATAETSPPSQALAPDVSKLRSELDKLPNRQREVLHLVFYGDLSISEASVVMGVTLGTARTHYERGKGKLRVKLGVEPGMEATK